MIIPIATYLALLLATSGFHPYELALIRTYVYISASSYIHA